MKNLLTSNTILLSLLPFSNSQQTFYLTDVPGYSSLARCALSAVATAFNSLSSNCNADSKPTAYASCACLKNQNSASISQRIVTEVKYYCGSLSTDDITSATLVWSTYCAPAIPASTAATTTTQAPPTLTALPALTQITAAATLAACAATGVSNAIHSLSTDIPPLARPEDQASCACLKNQNSLYLSQRIVHAVGEYCSTTATEDIASALTLFSAYCALGTPLARTTPFAPAITSIGPMSAIQCLTSLAPCASSAFSAAVSSLTYNGCDAGFLPPAFASCACANTTNSNYFSVKLVTNVGYYCSSTATEDVTSALAVFSSFCALAGGASGPATAATAGPGAVTYVGTTAATTFGVTPTPSNTAAAAAGDSGGFTQSDKIALGCGLGVGVPATLATIATLWLMCVRRSDHRVVPPQPYNYGPVWR